MKVAVFGKPGGGKTTLSIELARVTGLPLHLLDLVQFAEGGARMPDDLFLERHAEILAGEHWVVDGFGNPQAFANLLNAADVLVYIERSSIVHYWWVTKRLVKSPFSHPLGWPKGSPMIRSTVDSYRFLRLSHKFWTPAFRERLLALRESKRVFMITRQSEARAAIAEIQHDVRGSPCITC
jgi:adenylate kinase family enzyme